MKRFRMIAAVVAATLVAVGLPGAYGKPSEIAAVAADERAVPSSRHRDGKLRSRAGQAPREAGGPSGALSSELREQDGEEADTGLQSVRQSFADPGDLMPDVDSLRCLSADIAVAGAKYAYNACRAAARAIPGGNPDLHCEGMYEFVRAAEAFRDLCLRKIPGGGGPVF